ncbi:hypothetical protein V8F06_013693 [Rhypophila decipiens]
MVLLKPISPFVIWPMLTLPLLPRHAIPILFVSSSADERLPAARIHRGTSSGPGEHARNVGKPVWLKQTNLVDMSAFLACFPSFVCWSARIIRAGPCGEPGPGRCHLTTNALNPPSWTKSWLMRRPPATTKPRPRYRHGAPNLVSIFGRGSNASEGFATSLFLMSLHFQHFVSRRGKQYSVVYNASIWQGS